MSARSLLFLSLFPAAMLPGCSGTRNLGLDPIHQPVVSRASYSLDVATGQDGLAPGEARRLAGWFTTLRLGYGDQIAIDDPARDPRIRDAVSGEVARFGLLVSEDQAFTGTPVASGTARVVVNRLSASVPGCPDWSRNGAHEFEASTSSNYGCATNASLAAMVANPADLVRGETGSGTADPVTSAKAISSLRASAPSGAGGTAIKAESTGGK